MNWSSRIRQFGKLQNARKTLQTVARSYSLLLILIAVIIPVSLSIVVYRFFDDRDYNEQSPTSTSTVENSINNNDTPKVLQVTLETSASESVASVPAMSVDAETTAPNSSNKSLSVELSTDESNTGSSQSKFGFFSEPEQNFDVDSLTTPRFYAMLSSDWILEEADQTKYFSKQSLSAPVDSKSQTEQASNSKENEYSVEAGQMLADKEDELITSVAATKTPMGQVVMPDTDEIVGEASQSAPDFGDQLAHSSSPFESLRPRAVKPEPDKTAEQNGHHTSDVNDEVKTVAVSIGIPEQQVAMLGSDKTVVEADQFAIYADDRLANSSPRFESLEQQAITPKLDASADRIDQDALDAEDEVKIAVVSVETLVQQVAMPDSSEAVVEVDQSATDTGDRLAYYSTSSESFEQQVKPELDTVVGRDVQDGLDAENEVKIAVASVETLVQQVAIPESDQAVDRIDRIATDTGARLAYYSAPFESFEQPAVTTELDTVADGVSPTASDAGYESELTHTEFEKTERQVVKLDSDGFADSPDQTIAEAGDGFEYDISPREQPSAQQVSMLGHELSVEDKHPVIGTQQSAPISSEIEFELESSPIDVMSIVPEGLELDWTTTVLGKNDTVSKVFKRNGIELTLMYRLLDMPGTKMLDTVFPRDEFRIARSGDGRLVGIEFRRPKKGTLMFLINGDDIEIVEPAIAKKANSLQSLLDTQRNVVLQDEQEKFGKAVATISDKTLTWHDVTVRRGDTLGRIFNRIGISGALEVANAPAGNWLRSGLMPKQEIRIATHADQTFALIEVSDIKNERIRMVVADGEDFAVGFRKMQTEVREFQACATVKYNLYSAAKSADISNAVVDEFSQLFASRIDFSRQLKKGDRYCMIYEQKFAKEKQVGRVSIVAASLEQKHHHTQAYRVTSEVGDVRYYDQDGENMQGHFLRAPVKSVRVTSVFSNNRFHPVLKRYRKHQGVDYGAARNTPIMATADGVVSQRTYDPQGYGKVIVIRHGSKYETVYAHMNRFAKNTSVGSYVKRGQVIGYVGSTGMSTGDHVHYEFRVYGVHRDPLNYEMPKGEPVPAEIRDEFDQMVEILSARLNDLNNTKLASASQDPQKQSAK